jgi:putative ABC transport system ATP-binding protein
MSRSMLILSDATRQFSGRGSVVRALDGVSLAVEGGELVVVRGPSGCGKTSLLLTAGGLLAPDTGRVEIDGQDPYALSPNDRATQRARTTGFVFQQFHLIPYLSALDNVRAAGIASQDSGSEDRAVDLLTQLGLAERLRHLPAELSTGEQQRTALARALLNKPGLLLADEPTGNLDPDNGGLILEHMSAFARAGGAVLLVTHDTAAAAFADRIIQMERGRICDTGTAS